MVVSTFSSQAGTLRLRQVIGSMALFALLSAVQAYGEEATVAKQGAPEASPTDALSEIVVTAQKRSQNLRDVPISITVLNAATLENAGISTSADLPLITPGLRIQTVGTFFQPSIRGVSTAITAAGAEANVATYIDGVYQPDMVGNTYDLPDIERVEVLKGPQGTLFGRNATGGAIRLITADPSFTFKGQALVGVGSYNDVQERLRLSGPLIEDKLAFSLAAFHERNGGYINQLLNDSTTGTLTTYLIRGKLLFQPSDVAKYVLSASYSRRDDPVSLDYSSLNGNYFGAHFPGAVVAREPYQTAFDCCDTSYSSNRNVNLKADFELGMGTLTNLTAAEIVDTRQFTDGDGGYVPTPNYSIHTYNHTYSEELDFASKAVGPVDFVSGLFYYNATAAFNPLGIVKLFNIYTKDEDSSAAVFTEVNYKVLSQLKLTAGARYSYEKRTGFAGLTTTPDLLGKATFHKVTPRFSATYSVTDTTNAYLTYSEGFKSGVFNEVAFSKTPIQPETIKAIEVGVKSQPVPWLQLSAAAFHYDYKNVQVSTIQGLFLVLSNAASEHINGGELNASARLANDFNISSGISILHARFSSFPNAEAHLPLPAGGNNDISIDATGNTPIRSPEFTMNLSADYKHSLWNGDLALSGNIYYSSKFYFDVANRVTQTGYTTINSLVSWKPSIGHWRVLFEAKNITNKTVLLGATITNFGDAVNYEPPRTFTGKVEFNF